MRCIEVGTLDFSALNALLRETEGDTELLGCLGQRFIGAGMGERQLRIHGIPGNALGAYLNGGEIEVFGNAQDAVGDTMNAGNILVHGSIGDTAGYAMQAYQDRIPAIVIGGRTGSFLGEYQAGGILVVLGLHTDGRPIVGNYPCTGMHGGKVFLRSDCADVTFPRQVTARAAAPEDLAEIEGYLREYCELFRLDAEAILASRFTVVTPDSANPYRQMYVAN